MDFFENSKLANCSRKTSHFFSHMCISALTGTSAEQIQ